jgi:hypothetical protein
MGIADEYERKANALKARITTLRNFMSSSNYTSEVSSNIFSKDSNQQSQDLASTQRTIDTPKIEPDWTAINKLKAKNDAMEAKAAEMDVLRTKFQKK